MLAGGRSSRMGIDKASMIFRGRPLALSVADRVREVCGNATLVADPARYAALGLPVIADNFPGEGPLSGIEAALAATSADWNLIVACDMPALNRQILESLFAGDADCTLPAGPGGKVEPLCAVYHRRCLSAIREAIGAGKRKVAAALPPERLRYVQVADTAPFANLNTPEDLREHMRGDDRKRHG